MSKDSLRFFFLFLFTLVARGCNFPVTIQGDITFAVGLNAPAPGGGIGHQAKLAPTALKKPQMKKIKKP